MASVNGHVPLSAIDLLGLAEQKKVARIDLAEAGYGGIVYVCDLTAAQQQRILASGRRGKTRIYKDSSMDVDWADIDSDAGARYLEACLVTDAEGGAALARAFDAAGDDAEYVVIAASELVYMAEMLTAELKKPHLMREKLSQFPNAVTSLIVATVRRISGMAEDRVEEKKENS